MERIVAFFEAVDVPAVVAVQTYTFDFDVRIHPLEIFLHLVEAEIF